MKKTEHTIGFKSEIYDTRVAVRGSKTKTDSSCNALPSITLSDNRYFAAIFSAMNDFLDDEVNGYYYTENTLTKKIEAARLLFGTDKAMLNKAYKSRQCSIIKA